MGNSPSTAEIVQDTVDDVKAQRDLIKEIDALFEQLRSRFDDDFKKIGNGVVLFKHESFNFKYTRADEIAGIVDSVTDGLLALKPQVKDAKSLDVTTMTNGALQVLIDGSIGTTIDQLTELFAMIGPSLGQRSGTSYEWSTDMRLLNSNMFLYNAAFVYKFADTRWFKSKEIVAIGYFSYIFQSNAFVDNFEGLKKSLERLDEFDAKAEQLRYLDKKLAGMLQEALENDDDEALLKKYERFAPIAEKARKELLG